MELACHILKKSKYKRTHEYNNLYENFHKLNLITLCGKLPPDMFLATINNPHYINETKRMLSQYTVDISNDLAISILMAYYFSAYSEKIFDEYKTRFETKLIHYANQIIVQLSELSTESTNVSNSTKSSLDTFIDTVDNYYTLYQIWASKKSISEFNDLYELIEDDLNLCNILHKKKKINDSIHQSSDPIHQSSNSNTFNNNSIHQSSEPINQSSNHIHQYATIHQPATIHQSATIHQYATIHQSLITNIDNLKMKIKLLFELNCLFATQILLHNYDSFKNIETNNIYPFIWSQITNSYNTTNAKENMILIIITELKIKLIKTLTNLTARKDLYYQIDTENIIEHIRNGSLNHDTINKIMAQLQAKTHMINPEYQMVNLEKDYQKSIINIFANMYNFVKI